MKRILLIILITISVTSCVANKNIVPHEMEKSAYEWYNEGMQEYINGDYKVAEHSLLMVNEQHPGSIYSKMANLALGDVYFKRGEYILARDYYKRFIKLYPDSKEAIYAQYMVALSYYEVKNGYKLDATPIEDAIKEFLKLLKSYPNNAYAQKSYYYLERSALELYKHELFVAKFYYNLNRYKAANITLDYMESHFRDVKFNSEMLYLLSATNHYLKKERLAIEFFDKLRHEDPHSRYVKQLTRLLHIKIDDKNK